jgi:hypothetical protein
MSVSPVCFVVASDLRRLCCTPSDKNLFKNYAKDGLNLKMQSLFVNIFKFTSSSASNYLFSNARSFAERDDGLAAISSGPAIIGLGVSMVPAP